MGAAERPFFRYSPITEREPIRWPDGARVALWVVPNTKFCVGLSREEADELIRDTAATLERHTGKKLKGMFGPSGSITPNTMGLMAEEGLIYSADWYVDDQPFPIDVDAGRLVCVPYTWELNDGLCMTEGFSQGLGTHEGDYFLQICKDQFDTLYDE